MRLKKKKIVQIILFVAFLILFLYLYSIGQDILTGFNFHYLIYSIPSHIHLLQSEDILPINNNPSSSANSVPVLVYHGVLLKNDGYNLDYKLFNEHMFALKKEGWQTVSIEDFNAFIKGEKLLPEKSFLLTFDDGRKDSYYPVDPILKAMNYTAVTYIITGESLAKNRQSSDFQLNIRELKRMIHSGRWELQAHAKHGHTFINISKEGSTGAFYSNKMWLPKENRLETDAEYEQRVYNDMAGAKADLESQFGINVVSFAYPFNEYGEIGLSNTNISKEIISESARKLYDIGFYQTYIGPTFLYNYQDEDKAYVKRIEPGYNWTGEYLISYLEIGKEKKLPYDTRETSFVGWTDNFGTLEEDNGRLIAKSDVNKNEVLAFLDGSYLWRDYTYSLKVNSFDAESFGLIARFQTEKDYTICTFSNRIVRITQFSDGKRISIAQKTLPQEQTYPGKEVGISVKGNKITCMIQGSEVLSGYMHNVVPNGGIGFSAYNPATNSLIIVSEIKVI